MINYFICTQPRSGTHLLRELLSQQGCGNPEEFHFLTVGVIKTLDDLLRKCTIDDVVGVTIHRVHFGGVIKYLKKSLSLETEENPLRVLETFFPEPKFIYLYRRDKVKQAISFKKAHRTDHYTYKGDPNFGEYSEQEIAVFIQHLCIAEALWMQFFHKHHIEPYILTYEDLCENPVGAVRRILEFLQFDKAPIEVNEENLPVRQYNEISEKWHNRYLLQGMPFPEIKKRGG